MEMDKDQRLDDLFSQVRNESPQVSFEEMKTDFISNVSSASYQTSSNGTSNLFTIKTWTIMITTILTAALSAYFVIGNNPKTEPETKTYEPELKNISTIEVDLFLEEIDQEIFPEKISAEVYIPKISMEEQIEQVQKPIKPRVEELKPEQAVFTDSTQKEEVYRFPTLTEDEKKMYAKQKAKMIKCLIKRDKKMYAFIPSGSMNYQFADISVLPFHMQITEVTNLQYRTFLFDILQQGRKEDFLEAKPDQKLWLMDHPKYNEPMVQLYFSHPAYNHYPINNISRRGAELYCDWLTKETNKVLKSKKKPEVNDVRLPSVFEWVYAAKGGHELSPYPWGGPYNRNAQGCYLANFNPIGENPNDDGAMHTANVMSYAPNGYGLYCMSGNIAEMVYYIGGKSEPGTKGGSFMSNSQNIQIDGEDEFKGITDPNVNIGFRVVVSYGIVGEKGAKK